jgi:DNA-binding NarL/FixJ family response regulator
MYFAAIVDAHPVTCTGIWNVLRSSGSFVVCAGVGSPSELDDLERLDLVVLDLYAGGSGPAYRAVTELAGVTRVLVTSPRSDAAELFACLRAGALGLLAKEAPHRELLTAARAVASGAGYIPSQLTVSLRSLLLAESPAEQPLLSPRESETLRLIAEGLTHQQVARRMGLTTATVETYAKRIRAKLNAGNKADLTRVALELGLGPVTPPRGWSPDATGYQAHRVQLTSAADAPRW